MKSRSRMLLIITFLAALLALMLPGCRPFNTRTQRHTKRASTAPFCPIDGEEVPAESLNRRPLAVMIENSPRARPQTGLDQACVVYEAITEGGITRFMAIYLHRDPDVIGPVRSARPHFIHLEREYDAAYVHCGESIEALEILDSDSSIFDFSELKYHEPFWRDRSRRAPHNLYTSSAKLRAWMVKHDWEAPIQRRLPSFIGKGHMPDMATAASTVEINFGGAVRYRLKFVYDEKLGGYYRYMDGKLHVDRITGKPLVVANIILQHVWTEPYGNSKHGTQFVKVTGNGTGYFITGGKRIDMTWEKLSETQPTTYADALDRPLAFSRGQTWVEIIPIDGKVTISAPNANEK